MNLASKIAARGLIPNFWNGRTVGVLAACIPLLWSPLATPQEGPSRPLPDHAHMMDYGSRWECHRGFRKGAESCNPGRDS